MAVSAFVRSAVLREVDTALAAETKVVLTQAEARLFIAALDAPFQPNDRLKNAIDCAAQVSARR